MPNLEDYQLRFVQAVRQVIAGNWLHKRPAIRILDMGCDCSGLQIAELTRLTKGEVVGINIPDDFPSESAMMIAGQQASLLRMDGMQLQFPDQSFDLVISANVIEHVPDPTKFIREAARVLKPNGVCYLETAPLWSGPRGHHVMESMIAQNCPQEANFRDDGSVIPHWSHLTLDRNQLAELLRQKLQPETCDYIIQLVYDSTVLNRIPWRNILKSLEEAFPFNSITPWDQHHENEEYRPQDNLDDYSVYGFHALGRKRPKSWIKWKLCHRLRRLGW